MAHIMVIDDDPDVCMVLRFLFEDEGYRVTVANNGQVGLTMIMDDPADTIVLDVNMPIMGGKDFSRAYRSLGGRAPIVVLSATSEIARRAAIETIKPDAEVPKPFDAERLLDVVEGLLDGAREVGYNHVEIR